MPRKRGPKARNPKHRKTSSRVNKRNNAFNLGSIFQGVDTEVGKLNRTVTVETHKECHTEGIHIGAASHTNYNPSSRVEIWDPGLLAGHESQETYRDKLSEVLLTINQEKPLMLIRT